MSTRWFNIYSNDIVNLKFRTDIYIILLCELQNDRFLTFYHDNKSEYSVTVGILSEYSCIKYNNQDNKFGRVTLLPSII